MLWFGIRKRARILRWVDHLIAEARREKREFVVFNWVVGKICGWNVGNFQWKRTNKTGSEICIRLRRLELSAGLYGK
jgi:hypothetical protein